MLWTEINDIFEVQAIFAINLWGVDSINDLITGLTQSCDESFKLLHQGLSRAEKARNTRLS